MICNGHRVKGMQAQQRKRPAHLMHTHLVRPPAPLLPPRLLLLRALQRRLRLARAVGAERRELHGVA
jgi:hypothetical protein